MPKTKNLNIFQFGCFYVIFALRFSTMNLRDKIRQKTAKNHLKTAKNYQK